MLSLSLVIIGLDLTILNVALPTIQRTFSATASALQWMVDAYALVFAGLLLPIGALGDRFGRRRVLQVGLIVFGGASLGAVFAQSSDHLIVARALMGVGGAMIMPSTLSIITNILNNMRAKAIAIWSAVAGIGVGLGPLAGGLLLEYFEWGSVFLVNIPVVLIAVVAGVVLVPESKDPNPRRIDVLGAILSIAALTSLIYAIIEAPIRGWTDTLIVGLFAGSVVLVGAFILWEKRVSQPMLDLAFFQNSRFAVGAGAITVAFFALAGFVFAFTQYLQFVQGFTPLEAGVRLLPIVVGIGIGARLSERLSGRLGTSRVVAGGMMVLAGVLAGVAFWSPDTSYWIIGLSVFGISFGLANVFAPSTDAVVGAVPESRAEVASAMNDVTRQLGSALGVAVIGSVINSAYRASVEPIVSTIPLSPEASELASNSVGFATQIAAQLPGDAGEALATAARSGFTDAMGTAVLVAMGVLVVSAIAVARFMPARGRPDAPVDEAVEATEDIRSTVEPARVVGF